MEAALQTVAARLDVRAALRREHGPTPFIDADEPALVAALVELLRDAVDHIPDGGREANLLTIRIGGTAAGARLEVLGPAPAAGEAPWRELARAAGATVEAGRALTVPAARVGPAPSTAPRGRVLLVDDDQDVLRSMQRGLAFQHEVTAIDDARHALRAIADGERFDIILCDLVMPNLSGIELHARLAIVAPEVLARIIFVTGGAFTPATQEFLARVRAVEKPVTLATIRKLVASALDPGA
ncbi:MAG: response regulator [Deltaproteobacteria bacterium]|nr:response regulator [Deltaproteobacteria bacterium]